jgi:hypothetical protein
MAACIGDWCEICKILSHAHKFDPAITCVQKNYDYGQLKFEFICSRRHHYIADLRNGKRGCRSCNVLKIARHQLGVDSALMLDRLCLNADDDSRLRFHCNKFRHNPACENPECVEIREGAVSSQREYAAGCKNFVPCNQDFYMTPRQVRYESKALQCRDDHRWDSRKEVYSTVRMIELLFDDRFDDTLPDVEFTGLNLRLGIAVTHLIDKKPAKMLAAAMRRCAQRKITLVIIPAEVIKTSHIATKMVTQLHAADKLSGQTIAAATRVMRTRMHEMDSAHKLFDDRCCY